MTLTEDDAARVVDSVVTLLQQQQARDVLAGIDESRRLGVEEVLPEQRGSELKRVAPTRRRPRNNVEMVHVLLDLLYERLIVLPQIRVKLKERLGTENITWRVDTEFASVERFPEAKVSDLLASGVEDVRGNLTRIIELSRLSSTTQGT